jgi:hypothetical protein
MGAGGRGVRGARRGAVGLLGEEEKCRGAGGGEEQEEVSCRTELSEEEKWGGAGGGEGAGLNGEPGGCWKGWGVRSGGCWMG